MTSNVETEFEAELRSLLSAGKKIEAIKRYRERTGAGLADAKDAVEALERRDPPTGERLAGQALEDEVITLLERGQKIDAIKLYRESTGTGLKESKDAVEALAAERGIATGGGCLSVVLFAVLGVMLICG